MNYQDACKAAKSNKGIFYTYDAGNGKIGGVYWSLAGLMIHKKFRIVFDPYHALVNLLAVITPWSFY